MIWDFNYDSPVAIKALLAEQGLSMSKKFGQNFMIDTHARSRICALAGDIGSQSVWEIGPGIGALTYGLLNAGARVTAFEIDHGFCRILRERAFAGETGFNLVEGDFLKTWESEFARCGTPDVLFSNLPYNVGSVCIARILEGRCFPSLMVFTLQTEVARRLSARPGDPDWSSLSLLAALDYETRIEFAIPGSCFYPPPNVTSSVVTMRKRQQSLMPQQLRPVFLSLSRQLFNQKRKTLKNNLSSYPDAEQRLRNAGINPATRAENLDVEAVVSLCRAFSEGQR